MSEALDGRNYLVVALDEPDQERALTLVRNLREEVGLFKIGLRLYWATRGDIVRILLTELGLPPARIFLDLKFYDIPATVIGVLETLPAGLAFLTLPCDLGQAALSRIIQAAPGEQRFLGVTVLTSLGPQDLDRLGCRPDLAAAPEKLVVQRALLAREAGCVGVVCSGREAKAVKEACGQDFVVVCPGIRPLWAATPGDDQARVVTPEEAVRNGADYLVVGRPILNAADPVAAARRIVREIAAALSFLEAPLRPASPGSESGEP